MNYLNFILPPIIIVASLGLIIFVIARKTLEVNKRIERGEEINSGDNVVVAKVKSGGLSFLEKLAHWFKIQSLKMHNWVENKLAFIKRKKIEIKEANQEQILEAKKPAIGNKEAIKESRLGIIKAQIKRKIGKKSNRKSKPVNDIKVNNDLDIKKKKKEKIIKTSEKDTSRAMVSDQAVYPENKNKLEQVLIERIAFDPRDINAYEKLGDYYVEQGSNDDAKECYNQVLRLNSNDLNVIKKLGRIKQ